MRALATCPRLRHLHLDGVQTTTEEGIRALATSQSLRILRILRGAVPQRLSDEELSTLLPHFSGLQSLGLGHSRFGDISAGIAPLENLEQLDVDDTGLTDAGLLKLASLPRLRILDANTSRVTAEGIAAFERAHPNCLLIR